jgi:xylulokinase
MRGPLLIGVDVGTTSVKASLFDADGTVLRSYASRYPTRIEAPSLSEQAPADWVERSTAALAQLSDGLPPGVVAGIGLTSQVNTHVFVGDDGLALAPAITWQDGRAAAVAALLDGQLRAEDRLRWWGAPLGIDASHVMARAAWMARHHPDLWGRSRWVMAPKDYCLLALTGAPSADPMSSFGVIDQSLGYIDALVALVPGLRQRLPPLHGFTEAVGKVRAGLPLAGTPVVATTMDAWASLFGSGVLRDGEAMYLSGTSEVAGIVSAARVPTPGVIAFPTIEGITLHAAPTQAGGASLAFLSRLTGQTPEALSALAAAADPHRPVPVFLPHLMGERAPLWDTAARGSFSGIDASMGAAEFARAVFEGVAYSVRLLLENLEASAACRPAAFNATGGGTASDPWCQIRADVLGRPLNRLRTLDAGVLGAAVLAGAGTGAFASIAEAAGRLAVVDRVFEPDPRRADRYDFGFSRYKELYQSLRGFNAAVTTFTGW